MSRSFRLLHNLWVWCALCTLPAGVAGCSDSGTVPEFDRTPEETPAAPAPAPEAAEPFLELTPQELCFDAAGNALAADSLTIQTNCTWRLELSEPIDWIIPDVLAGTGSGSVHFRLYIDETFRQVGGTVVATAADGQTTLTAQFTLRQGTPSEAEPGDSDTPEDPDDPKDPEGPEAPDDSGDPGTPEPPGEPQPDNPESPDPNDPPTGPDESDTPDTPTPPADDPSDEPADDPSGEGPGSATPPTGDLPSEKPADTPSDTPSDEPAATPGGRDDFAALQPDSRFMSQVGPTPDGWRAEHCAVYTGGPIDSDPLYGSLLGADRSVRGLCMNGQRTAVGRIVSPELPGGCGVLTFRYGITNLGDEQIDFSVEIQQNGVAVRTFPIRATAEKFKEYGCTLEVHVAGPFRIVFTNNGPSRADREKDRYTIFDIAWTGEANP